MKLVKTIVIAVLAILAAVVVWNVLAFVIGVAFKVTFFLLKVFIIGIIALPVFLYLRHKLLSSK
jgi:hypothetical protein